MLVVVGQRLPVEFGWWVSLVGVSLICLVCVARLCVCVCVIGLLAYPRVVFVSF